MGVVVHKELGLIFDGSKIAILGKLIRVHRGIMVLNQKVCCP